MTEVEIVQLKVHNILEGFIGQPTKTSIGKIKTECANIVKEHPAILAHELHITTRWKSFTILEKFKALVKGELRSSQNQLKINLYLYPKKENNSIKCTLKL